MIKIVSFLCLQKGTWRLKMSNFHRQIELIAHKWSTDETIDLYEMFRYIKIESIVCTLFTVHLLAIKTEWYVNDLQCIASFLLAWKMPKGVTVFHNRKRRRSKRKIKEKSKMNRWMNAPFYISDRFKLCLCNHISMPPISNGTESHTYSIFLFFIFVLYAIINFIEA